MCETASFFYIPLFTPLSTMMNIPQSSFKDISLFQLTGPECTEKLKSALKSVNYTSGTDIGNMTLLNLVLSFSLLVRFNDHADKMFIVVSGTVGFFDSSCNKIGEGMAGIASCLISSV
jgi:hypothetical protein